MQATGQDQGQVLVENYRIEVEVNPAVEGNLQVPVDDRSIGHPPRDKFFGQHVHHSQVNHQSREYYTDVVDISEEVDVGEVLVEVGPRRIVQLYRQRFLPFRGVDGHVLVLHLSEPAQHPSQQPGSSQSSQKDMQPYFLQIVHQMGRYGLQTQEE